MHRLYFAMLKPPKKLICSCWNTFTFWNKVPREALDNWHHQKIYENKKIDYIRNSWGSSMKKMEFMIQAVSELHQHFNTKE